MMMMVTLDKKMTSAVNMGIGPSIKVCAGNNHLPNKTFIISLQLSFIAFVNDVDIENLTFQL